jgi:cyclophilin family peptidyl-prolyl cis-trans isomerase
MTILFCTTTGFVVQFGIASEPNETAKWEDTRLQDDPATQSNLMGTITYATNGPNSRTTNVFINLEDNSGLDQQGFAPFGIVLSGMNVLTTHLYNPTPGTLGGVSQKLYKEQGGEWVLGNYPEIDLIESTTLIEGAYEGGPTGPPTVDPETTFSDDDDDDNESSADSLTTTGPVLFRSDVFLGSTCWLLLLLLF